ncbi:molybdopterin-guanine dinucleotide biosynthesis protein B [Staphylococcus sp. ACRSN]|uniref:molybdopterin-guanine dinucleotide biosynthesis protein B n=1 Tax=Staphylococcus sp. ACRSN TaxID=2918214 RepID=UPI001EF1E31E|nr:molybdopterin-guanine dinucleotide biosynthesis protein B [Staphylococcus sp. ACRSN]MCG7338268.1 molybdopterin-guanine dinucleotide biosynthesis protein B [Staphylococcus sp. ACRSN]
MILQIVGYKKSGKTTLMAHTIKQLKLNNYKVATIKHHGDVCNDQVQDIELQNADVDHMKHFKAGADQSIVQGLNYQQSVSRSPKQTLTEIIQKSVTIDTNIILVEGYKDADFSKVLVYKDKEELKQLNHLSNIKYRINLHEQNALDRYNQWLLAFIQEGMK